MIHCRSSSDKPASVGACDMYTVLPAPDSVCCNSGRPVPLREVLIGIFERLPAMMVENRIYCFENYGDGMDEYFLLMPCHSWIPE